MTFIPHCSCYVCFRERRDCYFFLHKCSHVSAHHWNRDKENVISEFLWLIVAYSVGPLNEKCSIRSFSGLQFPAFGLNTEIYRANFRIQSKCCFVCSTMTIVDFPWNPTPLVYEKLLELSLKKLSNYNGKLFLCPPQK